MQISPLHPSLMIRSIVSCMSDARVGGHPVELVVQPLVDQLVQAILPKMLDLPNLLRIVLKLLAAGYITSSSDCFSLPTMGRDLGGDVGAHHVDGGGGGAAAARRTGRPA